MNWHLVKALPDLVYVVVLLRLITRVTVSVDFSRPVQWISFTKHLAIPTRSVRRHASGAGWIANILIACVFTVLKCFIIV
jgi:hypothetical protein